MPASAVSMPVPTVNMPPQIPCPFDRRGSPSELGKLRVYVADRIQRDASTRESRIDLDAINPICLLSEPDPTLS